jgi:hypothetical protein
LSLYFYAVSFAIFNKKYQGHWLIIQYFTSSEAKYVFDKNGLNLRELLGTRNTEFQTTSRILRLEQKNCRRTIASDIPTKEECAENGEKDNSVFSGWKIEEIIKTKILQ